MIILKKKKLTLIFLKLLQIMRQFITNDDAINYIGFNLSNKYIQN